MKINGRMIPMAVLITVLMVGATVSPAALAKPANRDGVALPIPDLTGGPVAGVTEDWWTAAQEYINTNLGITTTPDWSATGQLDGDNFGYSVAGAGDVNGDGYGDVIVGAHGFQGGANNGKAYAFYGSAMGLSTTPDWSSTGENDGGFGYSVAGAGDVNGDGYSDVVVGAPLYTSAGRVYIFYGSASGLNTAWGWQEVGDHDYDHFGISVAGAGDVNGDGYADVIVGADYYGDFNGRVCVYYGSASGPGTIWDWNVIGDTDYLYLGSAVAGAGDVNGDGFADVIVATTAYWSSRGQAYVYHGSASGLAISSSWSKTGENANDRFGRSVACAGDVNGDGYSDIIIGADGYNDYDDDDGRVYIYNGSSAGVSNTANWYVEGLVPGVADELGRSVACAGDVNGDGYADVVVGGTSRAMMYYGSATGPGTGWPDWFPDSENSGDMFGRAVAGAGDVNGDGYADIIVGAHGYVGGADKGKAYVYHGGGEPMHAFPEWSDIGVYEGDRFGRSVACAGDVNGDGYSDVIVGAPGYPGPSGEQGRVTLYLGSASGPATTPSWSANGEHDGDWFGSPVAGAGDVNGDGYGDVVIGAWKYDNGADADAGKVYVYYGNASGLGATAAWSVTGAHENYYLGISVAGAGDVNGDGYADIVMGASDEYAPGWGTVRVYHGSEAGLSSTPDWKKSGEQDWDHFGSSVAGAGDVNGDGYADIIVGTPDFGTEHGKAYVYHGSASGLGTTAAWTITGLDPLDQMGYAVAGAGDVNGDGYADIIVGALKTPTVDNPGKAYVFVGSASGLGSTAAWSATGGSNGDEFGRSVAGAGDVNGDGYADVVVGARGVSSSRGKIYVHLGSATGPDSTVDAFAEGESGGDNLGYAVAGAGDVNGDGFADVVAGAPFRDEPAQSAGKSYVYLGNGGSLGRMVTAQQARADASRQPVQPWGLSHTEGGFYLSVRATDPMGRGRVKLEVESCPPGVPFGDAACVRCISPSWKDVTATAEGIVLGLRVSGLTGETLYHWRARVLHAPLMVTRVVITPPPNPAHGPWRRFQAQAFEADVQTGNWMVYLPLAMRGYRP